jgi:hypothetical protein
MGMLATAPGVSWRKSISARVFPLFFLPFLAGIATDSFYNTVGPDTRSHRFAHFASSPTAPPLKRARHLPEAIIVIYSNNKHSFFTILNLIYYKSTVTDVLDVTKCQIRRHDNVASGWGRVAPNLNLIQPSTTNLQ